MRKLINISSLLILVIVFFGCKLKSSGEQEINKLLDRQTQLQESQDESLDQLQQLKDSLEHERKSLIGQREQKDQRIKHLEQNQQTLADQLEKEEQAAVSNEKSRLQNSIARYGDSIEQVKNELAILDTDLDSIKQNLDLYQVQETQADKALKSGISEVDQQITKLEKQKRQEIKKANLLKRRILVAEKKIEAHELERQMYVDERDNLLRIQASEDQLEPFRKRIAGMDSIISIQQTHKRSIGKELNQTEQWITEVDYMMSDLQAKIKQEYDRNQIIEGFITAEKQRLSNVSANLNKSRERLLAEQEMILNDLARAEEKIAPLNKELELIKNKEMSDILEQLAAIEQSEADLAKEEIQLLQESADLDKQMAEVTSDTSDELQNLQRLSNQLDSLKVSIDEEKTEIVKARLELSEKKAEAARQRARVGRTMGTLVIVIIIGGIVLLTLFYYLGKRARKS